MVQRERNNRQAIKASGSTRAAKPTVCDVNIRPQGRLLHYQKFSKDASAFQDTVQKLAQHMLTNVGWKQSPALGKAMTNLKDPMFDQPTWLVRMHYYK